MPTKKIIQTKKLIKNYVNGDITTKVLRGIDITIERGEFLSIMGPSGSGKSTLMHILGFLEKATSGIYTFEGDNVTNLDDNKQASLRNKEIGFVFQSFNLLPKLTILDNVKLPLIYSKNKKNMNKRATKVLQSVGLGNRLTHYPNQISGGQKQRVAIARALINNPSIIFADEPTGNLDSVSSIQIMEIFKKLNSEGNTIIFVTHDIKTAKYGHRIIKIKDGHII